MRVKNFLIADELLIRFLASGAWEFIVNSEIPKDAKIRAIGIDGNCIRVSVTHDSFEDVPIGSEIPSGKPPQITDTRTHNA